MLPLCRVDAKVDVPCTPFGVNIESTNVRAIILAVVFLLSLAPCLAVSATQGASSEQKRAAVVEMMMQFAVLNHCNRDCSGLDFIRRADQIEIVYAPSASSEQFRRVVVSAVRRRLELLGLSVPDSSTPPDGTLSVLVALPGGTTKSATVPYQCDVHIPPQLIPDQPIGDSLAAQDFAVNTTVNCVMLGFGYPEYRSVMRGIEDFFFRNYFQVTSRLASPTVSFEQLRSALDSGLQ